MASVRSLAARRVAIAVAGTAAIYWLAARLALWMAIPPGYATAVWPAAGLALVCVLAWGPRAAVGIALASCLVNLGTSFDASTAPAIVRSFAIAAAIGTGAALQAWLGAALIRRRVGFPSRLDDERDIVLFIVLGGPVACLASATVGVTALSLAGVVEPSGFAFHWWTWWVGDTIGVLVFAPLALLVIPSSHPVWRRRRTIVGIPLVLGFAAATALFLRVSAWESARLRADFDRRAAPIEAVLASQLSTYEEVIRSLASLFDASEEVSRTEFRAFCSRALARHPAIRALSWNPRVTAARRADFEARARADGLDDFQLTERAPGGGLRVAGSRAEYVPVFFVEPQHDNLVVLGYDVASDAHRREVFDATRGDGLVASRRVDLVQADEASAGVLLVLPVLARSEPHEVLGYTVGAFRLRDLFDATLREVDHDGMSVELIDRSAGELLYATASTPADAITPLKFWIELGGRHWQLTISPTAAFLATQRSWQAWTVLAAGLLFVGLLGVFLLVTSGRSYRLHEGAERFRALVEASAQIAAEREVLLVQLRKLNAELEERVQARTSELTAALHEREVLLQEIHHRVKNNLQVISSLINMQVRKLEGANRDALEDCQTRVQAIALIHENLYQSRDYANVPFSEYTRTLVRNVFHTMGAAGNVALDMAIDDVAVPVDKAIPCGLMLNELITNALKHAFKDGRRGELRVELGKRGDRIRLVVQDNGIGLPADLDVRGVGSFGLQLVTTLVEQLDATLAVVSRHGTRFEVDFAVKRRGAQASPRPQEQR